MSLPFCVMEKNITAQEQITKMVKTLSNRLYSVYSNGNQDIGVLIFQNVNDDVYDDMVNDDILDNVIRHDGSEYIVSDDDMNLDKNSDNTANFTDYDHATHGISEVVKVDGQEYIVAFWAKDSSSVNNGDLISQLNNFNKITTPKLLHFNFKNYVVDGLYLQFLILFFKHYIYVILNL